MAHIRQILANLSISVSEFKKNPKTVVKAVKSEPIAVIINDKPAFYCVPADILESLYSKFYEMNEIQNIQELNNDSDDPVCTGDDDSFGVHDIFQTIEDEQAAKMASSDDLVDPIKNSVADPLDEEVANKLNCSIDNHLLESNNKVASLNAPNAMDLSFNDLGEQDNLSSFDEFNEVDPIRADGFNDSLLGNFDNSDKVNDDLNYVSSLTDMDDLRSPGIKSKDESHSEATLAHAEKVVKQEQETAKDTKASDTIPTDQVPCNQVPSDVSPSDAKASKSSKAKLAPTTDNKSTKDSGAKKSTQDGEQAKDLAQPKKELNIVQGTDHKISATSNNASANSSASSKSTSTSASASASANPSSKTASSKASTTKSDETKLNIDAGSQIQSNKDNSQSSNQVCEVLSDVNANNNQSMRNLVSGPHSFSLEHVAKTYSPYKQKKLLEKRQQELKKEQKAEHKAKQKELKKLEKAAKYLKLDPKSVQEAEKKKAKEQHSKDAKKSKKSKFVKLKPDDVKNV